VVMASRGQQQQQNLFFVVCVIINLLEEQGWRKSSGGRGGGHRGGTTNLSLYSFHVSLHKPPVHSRVYSFMPPRPMVDSVGDEFGIRSL
jgi:hypothetical protein